MSPPRGRPKLYDAPTALRAAGRVFWTRGYGDTSLDDLAAAMGMNRPSIYRAFGNKESLYRQVLQLFTEQMQQAFAQTVVQEADIRKGLERFYRAAIDVYLAEPDALGCLVMCTAPASAHVQPQVQAELLATIESLDQRLAQRIRLAIREGQLLASTDPKSLSRLLQAVLHSIALRARAGESKAALRRLGDAAVAGLLGASN